MLVQDLPWHPVVVHLPLALAVLIPILILVVLVGIKKFQWPRSTWWAVVLFCALGAGSSYVALETGEDVEDAVEAIVAKDIIHEHEDAAEFFAIGLWAVFFSACVPFLPFKNRSTFWPYIPALLVSFIVLVMGVRTGHSGGSLVYKHNAASALQPKNAAP